METTTPLYPELVPYTSGMLDVGDNHFIYWETAGNPQGKPALVVHGGPGSGATHWWRRLFDPRHYRIILFDQRNCGRSTPHASQEDINLSTNTTMHLVSDMEKLRRHLEVDEPWLLVGGSWGCTLALAYAQTFPQRISAMVLFGITTGRHSEFDWTFRGGLGQFFPVQWQELLDALPPLPPGGDITGMVHAYAMASNRDLQRQAVDAWCWWESATPDWPPKATLAPRFHDQRFALAYTRIVTHYVMHNGFLPDNTLIDGAARLDKVPGVLINGRMDFQAPLGNAWALHRAWPNSELVIVEDAGHSAGNTSTEAAIIAATDRFALRDR